MIETRIPSASLIFLDSPSNPDIDRSSGPAKSIYKAEYGGQIVAAKFYRRIDKEDGFEITGFTSAILELTAYSRFKESSLGIFIPEPIGLIRNSFDEVVGLAVEWIDGGKLDSLWELNQPRVEGELAALEQALLFEADRGLFIDNNMLSAPNVMLAPGRTPHLWLAECLVGEAIPLDRYARKIQFDLDNLTYIPRLEL